jgi:hypothetical protein
LNASDLVPLMGDKALIVVDLVGLLLIIIVFGYEFYSHRRGRSHRLEGRHASPFMRMRRKIPSSQSSSETIEDDQPK